MSSHITMQSTSYERATSAKSSARDLVVFSFPAPPFPGGPMATGASKSVFAEIRYIVRRSFRIHSYPGHSIGTV